MTRSLVIGMNERGMTRTLTGNDGNNGRMMYLVHYCTVNLRDSCILIWSIISCRQLVRPNHTTYQHAFVLAYHLQSYICTIKLMCILQQFYFLGLVQEVSHSHTILTAILPGEPG